MDSPAPGWILGEPDSAEDTSSGLTHTRDSSQLVVDHATGHKTRIEDRGFQKLNAVLTYAITS